MSIEHLLKKHPDKIPVMITRAISSRNLPDIDKHKFLIARDMTIGHVLTLVRRRIQLVNSSTALFVSVENKFVPSATLRIDSLYNAHKGSDDILHLQYYGENTFG